jgi:protein-disulfide isomerase
MAIRHFAAPILEDEMIPLRHLAIAAAMMALTWPVSAQSLTDQQKQEMGDFIRSYLLEHPEILREMADKLEQQDQQDEQIARTEGLAKQKDVVFRHDGDAVIGNPKGDVTIVEFMDYNCGWCKRSVGEVQALVEKDKNLRVVLKEFPIFGQHSEFAAKAALASIRQGKYWPFHQAMFAHEGQITDQVVLEIAKGQGLDVAKLNEDMKDQKVLNTISANYDLAKTLKLNGTPAFIVDSKVFPGYLPLDALEAAIAEVRAGGGCKLC